MIATPDPYRVTLVSADSIFPSPENDDLYGEIEHDEQMEALIDSIRRRGLEEPILVTEDGFILSGHRRYYAMQYLEEEVIPVRVKCGVFREGNDAYHSLLAEYNPQRIKRASSLLKEALLRDKSPEDTYDALRERHCASLEVDADFMEVDGTKDVDQITEKKMQFLTAVQGVIGDLRSYWPLSIRQIHYRLLNDPPLTSVPKRSKFDSESYRYRNDKASYDALVRLLKSARYHQHVPMNCIDDPTRPQKTWGGYSSVSHFVQSEITGFLSGFHRDRQADQPRHIEVFGEKNTLYRMLQRACGEYYVPFSIGRGFCSIPVWRDIAARFQRSCKDRMTLIIVSDYDPEGLELADDAIRSLEQLWHIPVDGHRVAITEEQIHELNLADDFNPAKETSKRYHKFVERTGGEETWEVEALPPDYLITQIKAAIEANMDMEVFEDVCDEEERNCEELFEVKQKIAGELRL